MTLALDGFISAGGQVGGRKGALRAVEVSLAPHAVPQVLALAHDVAELVVTVRAQPGRPDDLARL